MDRKVIRRKGARCLHWVRAWGSGKANGAPTPTLSGWERAHDNGIAAAASAIQREHLQRLDLRHVEDQSVALQTKGPVGGLGQ